MNKKRSSISPDDPNIVEIFREHCNSGWSAISFIGKVCGGARSYRQLVHNNEEFSKIAKQFDGNWRRRARNQTDVRDQAEIKN